jgi:alpha-1,4-digalacturonate transport system permease protein
MKRSKLSSFFLYFILIAAVLMALFPFYWMLITGLRPQNEVFTYPPKLWPSKFIWTHFLVAWKAANFSAYFKNSFIVTTCATFITVSINLLAGYAFAKFRFKGREILFMMALSTLMIPLQVIMIPDFIIIKHLKLMNSLPGLIIPPCAEVFGLFLARQFISEIPDELLEAARIDGASEFQLFRKIIVPNAGALINVLVIFTVTWRWNDFQWPLIVISSDDKYTVQLGLKMLANWSTVNWNDMMCASLISIVPILIVFLIFQKRFVQGIAFTGIKG